mmetsp:Transcript_12804/g.23964  ORF Transcript_12804/g.23964 Transcript_12804/m.23964 type:complete len:125 (+) Transcript_12804:177-551(+)
MQLLHAPRLVCVPDTWAGGHMDKENDGPPRSQGSPLSIAPGAFAAAFATLVPVPRILFACCLAGLITPPACIHILVLDGGCRFCLKRQELSSDFNSTNGWHLLPFKIFTCTQSAKSCGSLYQAR